MERILCPGCQSLLVVPPGHKVESGDVIVCGGCERFLVVNAALTPCYMAEYDIESALATYRFLKKLDAHPAINS